MTSGAESDSIAKYLQSWADSLAQVLGEVAASAIPCQLLSELPASAAPREGELWITVAATGTLRGEMGLSLSPSVTVRLAQILMSEPAATVEVTAEHREAALELWRQVSGLAATALKGRWGDVQFRLEPSEVAPSWPKSAGSWIRLGDDDANAIEIQISAALAACLREAQPDAQAPEIQQAASPKAVIEPTPVPADSKVNLDLLLDVELGVTLRFGSRRLLLREVLELNSGSVVSLDRQVQEPVDMLLDGRIIARGEIVVMDGNYGLHVTEVAPTS